MTDNPGRSLLGGLDVEGMLDQARQAQRRAAEAQSKRDELKATGSSDDGLVTATVNGVGRVVDLQLNARAMRLDSVTLTESLLNAIGHAYEDFQAQSDALAAEALGDPELYEKIKSGNFDMYEYLRSQGLKMPELRGMI
jgi:DNA-binding protein YbaB